MEKQKIRIGVASIFGIVFLCLMMAIAIFIPKPSAFQLYVFRIALALSAAGVAAMLPGILNVKSKMVKASGALGMFVLIFLGNPAQHLKGPGSDSAGGLDGGSGSGSGDVIQSIVVSFWTDTDDKDAEESVSIKMRTGDNEDLGHGGPWGKGEVWSVQESQNRGQPHEFNLSLVRPVKVSNLPKMKMDIIKSESGGNNGKPWQPKVKIGYKDKDGKVKWLVSSGTLTLGGQSPSRFVIGLGN